MADLVVGVQVPPLALKSLRNLTRCHTVSLCGFRFWGSFGAEIGPAGEHGERGPDRPPVIRENPIRTDFEGRPAPRPRSASRYQCRTGSVRSSCRRDFGHRLPQRIAVAIMLASTVLVVSCGDGGGGGGGTGGLAGACELIVVDCAGQGGLAGLSSVEECQQGATQNGITAECISCVLQGGCDYADRCHDPGNGCDLR